MKPVRCIRTLVAVAAGGLLVAACGDSNGSGSEDVHRFSFDAATDTYDVAGAAVSQSQVDRDLVGSVCSRCHANATAEVKESVHFKIAGRTARVLFPGGGAHGMLDRACGLPATTGLTNYTSNANLGECAKCHVGRYTPIMEDFFSLMFGQMGVADPTGQAAQLVEGGIDCLICHSDEYRSYPEGELASIAGHAPEDAASPTHYGFARVAHDDGDFDHDGQPDLVIDIDGDGVADAPLMIDTDGDGVPETRWPTVAQDRSKEALASIGSTTAENCLRCHEHARTGYKRGTLFADGYDVHATAATGAFENARNQCTACHTSQGHKFVRGHLIGGDLAAADYPPPPPGVAPDPNDPTDLTCVGCHAVEALPENIHRPSHLAAIACETCHIPFGSGITYSLFGDGGQVSFGRNPEGRDTLLVTADMYLAGDKADIDADYEAYRTRPLLQWFNGGTSFLAQSLAVRGMPNAKITPFKPMANGMVFDARYFSGETADNDVAPYNAHSMYRFFANGNNAEAFYALDMLDMLPQAVRSVTMADFADPDPSVQAMALMLIFPNLVYFDKASFGYEHYLTATGSPWDANGDGFVDAGRDFHFDMLAAANNGLRSFQGFNGPMGLPPEYEWYPPFDSIDELVSMKLPDGSLIKMFLQMQAASLPPEQQAPFLAAIANYPAFSNITLGGHGVLPATQALGANGACADCHGSNGVLAERHPVTRKVPTNMGPMGTFDLPLYQWKYYNVRALVNLGLATRNEDVVAGTADVDVDGDTAYVRASNSTFVLNWFVPSDPSGYRSADAPSALAGTDLTAADLTWSGGAWMPVLEPVTDLVPNYAILGYEARELMWDWQPSLK